MQLIYLRNRSFAHTHTHRESHPATHKPYIVNISSTRGEANKVVND